MTRQRAWSKTKLPSSSKKTGDYCSTAGTMNQHGTMAKRDRPQRSVRHFCHPKRASWGIWMRDWEGRHAINACIVWRGLVLVRLLGQVNFALWRFGPWVNLSLWLKKQDHMCWSQDCWEESQCLSEALQTTSQAGKNTSEKRKWQTLTLWVPLWRPSCGREAADDSGLPAVASVSTNPLPKSTGRKKNKRDKKRKNKKKRKKKEKDENRGTCYSTS